MLVLQTPIAYKLGSVDITAPVVKVHGPMPELDGSMVLIVMFGAVVNNEFVQSQWVPSMRLHVAHDGIRHPVTSRPIAGTENVLNRYHDAQVEGKRRRSERVAIYSMLRHAGLRGTYQSLAEITGAIGDVT